MHLEYVIPHLCSACWARMAFTQLMTTYKCTSQMLICTVPCLILGKFNRWQKMFNHSKQINGRCKEKSCRVLLKKFNILPLTREYLFSLISFIVEKKEKSQSELHSMNTRSKYHLHIPHANLTGYQKGVYSAQTKLYSVFHFTLKS